MMLKVGSADLVLRMIEAGGRAARPVAGEPDPGPPPETPAGPSNSTRHVITNHDALIINQCDRQQATRHGTEAGSVTLGGRRVAVIRPRVRTADGSGEVAVPAYELFNSHRDARADGDGADARRGSRPGATRWGWSRSGRAQRPQYARRASRRSHASSWR
jgi:hypothetical protein